MLSEWAALKTCTSNLMQPGQVIDRNLEAYTCTFMHVTRTMKKEAINFKGSKEGCVEGLEGRKGKGA